MHALQQRLNPSIFLAPKVIRDYSRLMIDIYTWHFNDHLHDNDTVGPSDTVPGIVLAHCTTWVFTPTNPVPVLQHQVQE